MLVVMSFLTVSLVSCNTSSKGHVFESEDEMVESVVGYLLHDISIQKVDQFRWFTKDVIIELYGSEENALKEGDLYEFILNEPETWKSELLKGMVGFNSMGKEVGINWNEYTLDSVSYETNVDDNNEKTYYGDAIITCGSQKFVMKFKNLFIHNGEGCYVDGIDFAKSGDDDSSITLNQEGTFEEFLLSLATCYSKGLAKEVDKIVMVDKNGLKIIGHETMIPSNFIDSFEETFLPSVKNHNYVAEKRSNDCFEQWGFFENTSLDKNELMKNSEIYEVLGGDEGTGVMSGLYYSYKGKWYLWHMY